jgi:hypothetical protein
LLYGKKKWNTEMFWEMAIIMNIFLLIIC